MTSNILGEYAIAAVMLVISLLLGLLTLNSVAHGRPNLNIYTYTEMELLRHR